MRGSFPKKLDIQKNDISDIFEVESENCAVYDMNLIDSLCSLELGVLNFCISILGWRKIRKSSARMSSPVSVTIGNKVN